MDESEQEKISAVVVESFCWPAYIYETIEKINAHFQIVWILNMSWMKKLSLFGGNWKSLIFRISIGINDYTHKDPKNQVDLIFQLFVYILQQF